VLQNNISKLKAVYKHMTQGKPGKWDGRERNEKLSHEHKELM
jgi:hypothetical protein